MMKYTDLFKKEDEHIINISTLKTFWEEVQDWCNRRFLTADDIESYGGLIQVNKRNADIVTNHKAPYVQLDAPCMQPQINELREELIKIKNSNEIAHIKIDALTIDRDRTARFRDNRGLRSQLCLYEEWAGDIYEVL